TVDESLIIETDGMYDHVYEMWSELGDLPGKPTAIFASNDVIALGIFNGIRDAGLTVPDDYEIICFEHSLLARVVRPQLTTIAVPLYDLGAVSMRLLTKLMNGEEVEEQQVILPYRLEERGTL